MKKYDEFWIYPRDRKIGDPDWEAAFSYPDALTPENGEQIHVIEYAAYTDAIKMLEEMAQALELECGNRCETAANPYHYRDVLDKYEKFKEGLSL